MSECITRVNQAFPMVSHACASCTICFASTPALQKSHPNLPTPSRPDQILRGCRGFCDGKTFRVDDTGCVSCASASGDYPELLT
eukprot:292574-Hanusia_phi.AAC.5